jgi:hypothetical protein
VWSNSHAMRPVQPGGVNLLAAWYLAKPFDRSPPLRIPQPFGDGDRNAIPPYDFRGRDIKNHLLMETPIRNSSLRTLENAGPGALARSTPSVLARIILPRVQHFRDLKGPRRDSALQRSRNGSH